MASLGGCDICGSQILNGKYCIDCMRVATDLALECGLLKEDVLDEKRSRQLSDAKTFVAKQVLGYDEFFEKLAKW